MESGGGDGDAAAPAAAMWRFGPNEVITSTSIGSIRAVLVDIMSFVDRGVPRLIIPLGHGDPSGSPCFRTTPAAADAIVAAVQSFAFNSYAISTAGLPPARRAVAEYLSRDLPYDLSMEDIFITAGCTQAIEIAISVIALPNANILLPRPGFPTYESRAVFSGLEARHYDLVPERGWEADLAAVEALADENTVAIVVINPGNPCGNVFSYEHLEKVAETAKKLGILIIADEVYGHLAFGENPFVPMGVFGGIAPVLTLGSISKRWSVPGWRLGWIATSDPHGVLRKTKVVDCIIDLLNITTDPVTFIQGAIPDIIANTSEDFFDNMNGILAQTAKICFDMISEIDCLVCPNKPQGSMFVMVKLDPSVLEDIGDDFEFCRKLSKEESVIIMPGSGMGKHNWLRITFGVAPVSLRDGLGRLKSFCQRHTKRSS